MKQFINTLIVCILTTSISALGMDTTPKKRIILDPAIKEKIRLAMAQPYEELKAKNAALALKALEATIPVEVHETPLLRDQTEIASQQEPELKVQEITKTLKKKKKKNKKQAPKAQPVIRRKQAPAKPKEPDTTASDAFWAALLKNDTSTVSNLLALQPLTVTLQVPHRTGMTTPLISAATEGYVAMCEILLNHGAKVDTLSTLRLPNKQGWIKLTALLLAVKSANVELARILLQHKADPNVAIIRIPSRAKEHALCCVAKVNTGPKKIYTPELQDQMIKLLLLNGATQFSGRLLFYDTTEGSGYEVLLTDTLYQDFLPRLIEGTEKIICKEGNIILFGSPVFNDGSEETESTELLENNEEERTTSPVSGFAN